MKIKTLQIHLTGEEYRQLLQIKGKKTWRELLLSLVERDKI